jgi:hypothetical protein
VKPNIAASAASYDQLAAVKQTTTLFINSLSPLDRVSLVTVADTVAEVRSCPTDHTETHATPVVRNRLLKAINAWKLLERKLFFRKSLKINFFSFQIIFRYRRKSHAGVRECIQSAFKVCPV